MAESDRITVVDKGGSRGIVVGKLETQEGQPTDVIVELEQGDQVLVPWDMIITRGNEYHLPARFTEMKRRTAEQVDERRVFPIIAEKLTIGKRVRETGKVRVTKSVQEREETVDEPTFREEIQVERVPVNRPVEGPVDSRYEGDTLIIPIIAEEVVLQKRAILKEELRITKRRVEEHHPQKVTLRTETVDVKRVPIDDTEAVRED